MRYRLRPRPIPTLATALLLPLLIGLGFWQLDRAAQKRALQEEYDQRAADAPALIANEPVSAEDMRYRHVIAKGYYEPERQILIDNRVHEGRVGYYVVTPLHLRDSDMRLLVNRGWVPLGTDREHLPPASAPMGLQEISGIATVPSERAFTLGSPESGWQVVWQNLDLVRYKKVVGVPLQPVVVLLDPASNAGGFVRVWGRFDTGIATHQGYAFQWFALAAALVTLFFMLNIEKSGTRR